MAGKKYGDLNASTGGGNSDQYAVNQDKGGGVFETRKMTGAQLFAWIRGKLGTAARKDHGTGAGDVPLNSDLSSAAFVDHGTGAGDVPLNSDLSSAAFVDHGTGAGDVPLNSDLSSAAFVDHGTGAGDVPTITDADARYARLTGGGDADFTAMPQVGGDAVVESSSNANGSYTKWADGTLMCRKYDLVGTATASLKYIAAPWTFPHAFYDDAVVSEGCMVIKSPHDVGGMSQWGAGYTQSPKKTSTTVVQGVVGASSGDQLAFNATAWGRWKS